MAPQANVEVENDSGEGAVSERDILAQQIETPLPKVNYFQLFRYATKKDLSIIAVSVFCAIVAGAITPMPALMTALLVGSIQESWARGGDDQSTRQELARYTVYFVYLFIGELVTCYIATVGFIRTGIVLSSRIREKYLAAVLRQNIAFFDNMGAGEITTHITADANLIRDGISEKASIAVQCSSAVITAFIIGFIRDWKLTLILASSPICIGIVLGVGGMLSTKYHQRWLGEMAEAGNVAEEAFAAVRTVMGLNAQSELASRLDGYLARAERWSIWVRAISGSLVGSIYAILYLACGLGFWMGSRYLVNGTTSFVDIMAIILAIVTGIFCLCGIIPPVQVFAVATAAASRLYGTIDRKPSLPVESRLEKTFDHISGHIELRNVKHVYPSRPDVVVLDNLSLEIESGKTTAIVGPSGSGKSTIIELLERFYDPLGGDILLDGHKMSEMSPSWLRQHTSLVEQSPVLFSTTIFENIRYGLTGTPQENTGEEELRELVFNACRIANAHEFISKFPDGYDTLVGEAGVMLSGGQRQRISIARALIRNPKILLLDEATSALDSTSEASVQAAIDGASQGRTTVIVAHRLSTIKSADKIIVLAGGRLIEQGTHEELLQVDGMYSKLAKTQTVDLADNGIQAAKAPIEEFDNRDDHGKHATEKDFSSVPGHSSTFRTDKDALESLNRPRNEYGIWTLLGFVTSLHKDCTSLMSLGFLLSVQTGAAAPVQAVFVSKCLTALARPPAEYGQLRSEINLWAGMHVVLAFVQLLACTAQGTVLGKCTEKLIRHVTGQSFLTLLNKKMAFFDMTENGVGALVSFLGTEPSSVAGMGCNAVGTYIMALTTLIGAVSASIAVGWKLGLVGLSTIPVLVVCGFLRIRVMAQLEDRLRKRYQEGAVLASEAVSSIRTVKFLNREHTVTATFHSQLAEQNSQSIRASLTSGALFAFSHSASMLCTALTLWYGGTLVISGEYSLFQFILSHTTINICGDTAGQLFSNSPDLAKAIGSATRLKALFRPLPQDYSGHAEARPLLEGNIKFQDVHFTYPTRPERQILKGLDLDILKGKYVALVGPSGCGKSTITALLERFYHPAAGVITMDDMNISSLDLRAYRDQVALVNQEPMLFQGTIRENLTLGLSENSVPQEELEKACKDAYILEFIQSLPLGFDTICGGKGNNFSGGQKQRLSIARALLRHPRVLLLDEVTSALDSEAQREVQVALDEAAKERTTITIAHRLSAIQNADVIYFLEDGVIVESGTHADLIRKKGKYFALSSLQNL
ncbi:hypothetical protein BS50DRAFT_568263 [Corynespora cassiicola Philippines]|uniref:P-loop containing nucleoside triphosphate hydrolase protein n=1 Tax=Corynespora cassiicola Philippines TaxID=1448308 RepID=A0A2T2P4N9_CORCC|nr:hypothetical protein BS50DRAFT_568263 [Corynespora cassiicola Philippines]